MLVEEAFPLDFILNNEHRLPVQLPIDVRWKEDEQPCEGSGTYRAQLSSSFQKASPCQLQDSTHTFPRRPKPGSLGTEALLISKCPERVVTAPRDVLEMYVLVLIRV